MFVLMLDKQQLVVIGTTFTKLNMTKAKDNVVPIKGFTQNITITFHDYKFQDDAMVADEAIFEDISGYSIGTQWVAISTKDGGTTVFPAQDIKKIQHYNKE